MGHRSLEWKEPKPREARWLALVGVIAIAAVCSALIINDIHRIGRRDTGDFEHFYYAADAVRHHADPYAAWTQGYIYPPLIAFLFQPLSWLGRDRAAAVMLIINVSATLIAVALAADEFLRRFGGSRSKLAIIVVVLLALVMNIDKVKSEWQMWQTDVLMLLLFVLALRWLDRRPILAGAVLGIAVNIKYLPLLFLPYLLIRRRWTASVSLIISTIVFAMVPALSTGWDENAHNWHTATNGLVQMTGAHSTPAAAAEIHDVTDSLSCSITSALARIARNSERGFLLAAGVAVIAFGIAWLIYRMRKIPMFQSIDEPRMRDAATAAEWVILLCAILAFSPQTNTRHLFDALLLTTAASVLLLFPGPEISRLPLLIGTAVIVLGFVLPPGHRTRIGEHTAAIDWLRYGGPCWCMLISAMTLLWTGLSTKVGDRESHARQNQ